MLHGIRVEISAPANVNCNLDPGGCTTTAHNKDTLGSRTLFVVRPTCDRFGQGFTHSSDYLLSHGVLLTTSMTHEEQDDEVLSKYRSSARTRQRRRVFDGSTGRTAPKSRHHLLLQDSASDSDLDCASPECPEVSDPSTSTGPSFQEIMSKLELIQHTSTLPRSPRSTLRSHRISSGASDGSLPRRWRHSRNLSDESKDLPALPAVQLKALLHRSEESRRHSAAISTSSDTVYRQSPFSTTISSSVTSLVDMDGLETEALAAVKILKRRQQILRELVTTEISFAEDLSVVVQEYQQKTATCSRLTPEECHLIFGGVEPVMSFSKDFGFDLQTAAAPVLFGEVTTMQELQQQDEETTIGAVFAQYMSRLGEVFARYCSNQEKAATCLHKVSQDKAVQSWLADRHPVDRTTAWDLPSLLIKPVQRVLKYPLLLATLLEATPRQHPEYFVIELALKEMLYTAENINKIKKRSDFVDSISTADKKRNLIAKTFSKRPIRVRTNTGTDDRSETLDPVCDGLIASFKAQQAVIQTLRSEIQEWLVSMKSALEYHVTLASTLQEIAICADAPPSSQLPVVDWLHYSRAISDLQQVEFVELTHTLERRVLKPLAILEGAFERPARVIIERDTRVDVVLRERNGKGNNRGALPDQAVTIATNEFSQLNITLKQELPVFLQTTEKAMDLVLLGLIQVQKNWLHYWASRLTPLIDINGDPGNIVQHFRDRYGIVLFHIGEIGLTDGSLIADNRQDRGHLRISEDNSSISDTASAKPGLGLPRFTVRDRALSVATSASVSLKHISDQIRSPSGATTPVRSRSSLQTLDLR